MIPYNVSEPRLALPEYGRNIQRMIDHCLTIEDRDERTRCARTIADLMVQMFPDLATEGEENRKVWDHMLIMSDFKLDIDFPCQVIEKSQLAVSREAMPYNNTFFRFRHYGRNIQSMIKKISEMDNDLEKDHLIFLTANQMKKQLLLHNPENASDAKVFADMAEISEGKIVIDPTAYRLNDYVDPDPQGGKQKKKKK